MCEVIAVHPGVIRSQFIKENTCWEAWLLILKLKRLVTKDTLMIKCCLCGRIDVEAGAQSSIYAASCPASDIPGDTIYFHNKHGH